MDPTVAEVFDGMAGSYDELEPWYEHLYRVLHDIVHAELRPPAGARRPRALDVGCGTGYQTAVLQALGYEAHGVDIAAALLAVARARVPDACLSRADALRLPYPGGAFDAVTCCGSTLSFVDDPARATAEMARVLRPGGRLLLECEHRFSLDLGWALASALTGDSLGYGMSPCDALRAVVHRGGGITISYPLPVAGGDVVNVRLRLFTRRELQGWLAASGLRVTGVRGIHAVTNVIPSTVLHRARLRRGIAALYRALARLDDALRSVPGAARLANSLVVSAVKPRPGTEQASGTRSAWEGQG